MVFLPFGDVFLISSDFLDNDGLTSALGMIPLQVHKLLVILELSRSGIDGFVR